MDRTQHVLNKTSLFTDNYEEAGRQKKGKEVQLDKMSTQA